MSGNIFLDQNSQNKEGENRGIWKLETKNSKIPKLKHNRICEIEFVYDLNTNGAQTKIKKAPKDQRTADSSN